MGDEGSEHMEKIHSIILGCTFILFLFPFAALLCFASEYINEWAAKNYQSVYISIFTLSYSYTYICFHTLHTYICSAIFMLWKH